MFAFSFPLSHCLQGTSAYLGCQDLGQVASGIHNLGPSEEIAIHLSMVLVA